MDVQTFRLRFVLIADGKPYKSTSYARVQVQSNDELYDLQEAIKAKCQNTLAVLDANDLSIFKINPTVEQSQDLLQEFKRGERIDMSSLNPVHLDGLAEIHDFFPGQPNNKVIHLIVDCSAAVRRRDDVTVPRWSIDEVDKDVVIQEVESTLFSNLQGFQMFDSRVYRPPIYQPGRQHPKSKAISRLNVPMVSGRPLLLLHNLPRNGSGGLVDTNYLEISLKPESSKRLAVILGASGSGKSRTVIELLCKKFGFYFTCATGGTEHAVGSRDMQEMVDKIKLKCGNPYMVAENDDYATRYMTSLVLARIYILNFLLSRAGITVTPYEWTMMQLFPLSVDDVFLVVSRIFRQLSSSVGLLLMDRWLKDLQTASGQRRFPLVIDEAQKLLNTQHVFSSFSEKENGRRPLYTLLIRHLTNTGLFFVMPCGSGLSLKAAEHYAGSNLMESTPRERLVVVAEHFPTVEAVGNFLATYEFPVGDLKNQRENLHQLTGRCRITTTFLQRWMTNSYPDTRSAIAEFRADYITDRDSGSFYRQLQDQFSNDRPRNVDGTDMFLLTRRAVIAYKMIGQPFIVTREEDLELFEIGVGRLIKQENSHLRAEVGEPLIVDAAWSYFMERGHHGHDFYGVNFTLEQMAELNHKPSARGQLYEEFLPARLPTLMQHRELFSPPLPYGHWVEHLPQNGTRMIVGSSEYELSAFLENPTATYYHPTDQAGPDLAGLFSPKTRSNQTYVLFVQGKLRKELDKCELSVALRTTAPADFYTVRKTGAILSGYEGHHNRVLKALASYQGIIRVIVAFPLDIQDKVNIPEDNYYTAKIDRSNADILFDATVQKFLTEAVLGYSGQKRRIEDTQGDLDS